MNREEEKISIRVELGLFVELSKTIQFYSNCNMTPIPDSTSPNRRVVSAALPSMINGVRCPMPTPRIAIRDWDLEGRRTWHIKERMNSLALPLFLSDLALAAVLISQLAGKPEEELRSEKLVG